MWLLVPPTCVFVRFWTEALVLDFSAQWQFSAANTPLLRSSGSTFKVEDRWSLQALDRSVGRRFYKLGLKYTAQEICIRIT